MPHATPRLALVLLGLLALPAEAGGQEPAKWYDRISFSGDFRLRSESFFQDGTADRTRGRIRLRAGFTAPLSDRFTLGVRLATGNPGNITSANVSLGDVFVQRSFTLDRAYLAWTPHARVRVTGGKFELPLWRPDGLLRSEIPFDEELAPEGLHQEVTLLSRASGRVRRLRLLGDQWMVREVSGGEDTWVLGAQAVLGLAVGGGALDLGLGYLNFVNGRVLAQARNTNGELLVTNRVVTRNGVLVRAGRPVAPSAGDPFDVFVSDFRLLRGAAGLTGRVRGRDVALSAEVIHNAGASVDNDAFWLAASVGSTRRPGGWGVAFGWARVEQEAVLSMMSYSDLGVGGTNVEGAIVQVTWRPLAALTLQAKNHLMTPVAGVPGVNPNRLQRLQLDARFTF